MKILKLYFFILGLVLGFGQTVIAAEWKNPDLQDEQKSSNPDSSRPAMQPVTVMEGEAGLEIQRVCNLQPTYNDKGSGGNQDVSFFLPVAPPGYSLLGGYAQGNHYSPDSCVMAVRPVNNDSNVLLQPPRDWQRIWTDRNSGARMDGSIWQAIPENADYICLGSVARQGYNKPVLPNYACIHQCLVEKVAVTNFIWSDRGTGASQDVSVYRLHNSNSFYAVPSHDSPRVLRDIKQRPVCKF